MNLKDKTVCVYDNGLFVDWAVKLSEFFGRSLVYVPWKSSFPTSVLYTAGAGLPNVERIYDFFDYVDEIDLFVFPDVYDGDLQVYLREQGKLVWGGAKGEELELQRWETKQLLKRLGLPVQPIKRVVGLDNLRKHLKTVDNKWIKISLLRGDCETFHHQNYRLTEPRLDELEMKLGARKQEKEFIVEDAIDNAVETGYDGFSIDGKFPKLPMFGYEIKDIGYIGLVQPYTQFSPKIRIVNDKFAPLFKNYQYRGFFSTEIRIGEDEQPYMTDPCCRSASPPSEIYQEMYTNWGEVIWAGAQGELVEPRPQSKYGVEAIIHSNWADKNWQAVYFPESIAPWVKLRNDCVVDGIHYIAPQGIGLPEVGAVVAVDDTLLGAMTKIRDYSKQIEGYSIKIILDALPEAVKVIQEGIEAGLKFGDDPIPTVGEVEELINA